MLKWIFQTYYLCAVPVFFRFEVFNRGCVLLKMFNYSYPAGEEKKKKLMIKMTKKKDPTHTRLPLTCCPAHKPEVRLSVYPEQSQVMSHLCSYPTVWTPLGSVTCPSCDSSQQRVPPPSPAPPWSSHAPSPSPPPPDHPPSPSPTFCWRLYG